MPKSKKNAANGRLVQAAIAIEESFERLETVTRESMKLPLTSQKSLAWTEEKLGSLAGMEEELQSRLTELTTALGAIGANQGELAQQLQTRANEFIERRKTFNDIMASYAQIRTEADATNQLVQALATRGTGKGPQVVDVAELETIERQLGALADRTAAVRDESNAKNFEDLAQQADALRQQLSAAQNKISLLREKLAGSPSAPLQN